MGCEEVCLDVLGWVKTELSLQSLQLGIIPISSGHCSDASPFACSHFISLGLAESRRRNFLEVFDVRTVRVAKDAPKGVVTHHHDANESLGRVANKLIHKVIDGISPLHSLLFASAVEVVVLENNWFLHGLFES